ncbi:MAG: hypothetical protein PHU63_00900 [Candidatus ainarchaeum sp.]|nr:hypothetical protein [Candidatus ainarchaeum sp.]
MNNGKIHFIITGGTIDSYFDPKKDATSIGEKSLIEEYIKRFSFTMKQYLRLQC